MKPVERTVNLWSQVLVHDTGNKSGSVKNPLPSACIWSAARKEQLDNSYTKS